MADQKISELTALTGANVADDDAIAIVDTSATETKKIVFSELKNALDTATGFVRITGDTMTGALDVQSTITSDGLTVDGSQTEVKFTTTAGRMDLFLTDTDTTDGQVRVRGDANSLSLITDTKLRQTISSGGDISFYEDSGITPKFHWSAADESLGIGTDSPAYALHVAGTNPSMVVESVTSSGSFIQFRNTGSPSGINRVGYAANSFVVDTNGSEAMRIDSSGNVGIGTDSLAGLKLVALGATGYPETSGVTQTGVLRLTGGTGLYNVLDMGVNESTDTAWIQATRANNLGAYDKLVINPYGGNVGIGTDSPTSELHLHVSGENNGAQIKFDSDYGIGYVGQENNASNNLIIGSSTAGITFYAANAEKMRIDSSGNVGIGTSSPSGQLELERASNANYTGTFDFLGAALQISDDSNSSTYPTASAQMQFKVGTTGVAESYIAGLRESANRSSLAFGTQAGAAREERMRIDSSGNVGIGTDSPSAAGSGYGALDVRGASGGGIRYGVDGGFNMLTYATGSATDFYASAASDMRFFTQGNSTASMLIDSSGLLNAYYGISVDGGTIKLDGNYPVGTDNVALGDTALDTTTGSYNTAIGSKALTANTSGITNSALGVQALETNTTGSDNTSMGGSSLRYNTTGAKNTAMGRDALRSNTTASWNTAVGYQAGNDNTTGLITAVGSQALLSNTEGQNNVAVGGYTSGTNYAALTFNTTGSNNTALGNGALQANTTASAHTAVGYQSGYSTVDSTTYGLTAHGYQSAFSTTSGTQSTAIGTQALYSNTTGSNVAIGNTTLYANTTGTGNTGLGTAALRFNTIASNNTAVGYQAGYSQTTSSYNTAVGNQALYSSNRTADLNGFNTAVGHQAGYSATTGQFNTYIGQSSGYYITTGSKNTILGPYTGNFGGLDIRTSSNNIVLSDGDGNPRVWIDSTPTVFIGNMDAWAGDSLAITGRSVASQSYSIAVRGGETTNNAMRIFYTGTGSQVGGITFTSSSTAFNTSSDYRLKENVVELTGATDRLKQLNPSRFNFIADASTTVDGFLAHEVQAVVPEAITGTHNEVDDEGNPVYQGIDQSKLVPLLVATIKELEARITALENA